MTKRRGVTCAPGHLLSSPQFVGWVFRICPVHYPDRSDISGNCCPYTRYSFFLQSKKKVVDANLNKRFIYHSNRFQNIAKFICKKKVPAYAGTGIGCLPLAAGTLCRGRVLGSTLRTCRLCGERCARHAVANQTVQDHTGSFVLHEVASFRGWEIVHRR
jgi:hypothetical protein